MEKSETKRDYINEIPPARLLNLSRKRYYNYNDFYYENFNLDDIYKSNIFNVCYMNSSIQCLFHLKDFADFIFNVPGKNLMKASKNLLLEMKNTKDECLSVNEIKKAMGAINERYKKNNQEDVNEFISIYLDGLFEETSDKSNLAPKLILNDELNKEAYNKFYDKFFQKKGYSPIIKLFYGLLRIEKYCKFCKLMFSIRFNPFNMIELPIYDLAKISKKKSLEFKDIYNNYLEEFKSGLFCETCKKEIYTKNEIFELPKNLIFYFGRTIGYEYIDNEINFYDSVTITSSEKKEKKTYNLVGIIYHSLFGYKIGHYTCSCKINNKWFFFDDDYYEKIERPDFNSREVIILFYKQE